MMSKRCSACGQTKLVSDYHKKRGAKDGLQAKCKPCNNKHVRLWQEEHKEEYLAKKRDYSGLPSTYDRKRALQYGMTDEEFLRHVKPATICSICRIPAKTLVVDHDHATGLVRGILCHPCNMSLGMMKDDVKRLRAAIDYLERPPLATHGFIWRESRTIQ